MTTGLDLKERILAAVSAAPGGLSAREIAQAVGVDVSKVRPRLSELKKARRLAPSPFRRRTAQHGCWNENVWLAPSPKAKAHDQTDT